MNKACVGAALVASLLVSLGADAGVKKPDNVLVLGDFYYAQGALGTARNSASDIEEIGCTVTVVVPGAKPSVQCWAMSAEGKHGACWSTDPGMVSLGLALRGDDYLEFGWDGKGGECLYMTVTQASSRDPKLP